MIRVCCALLLAACSSMPSGNILDGGGGQSDGPPVVIGACNSLPAAGTWEEITPPEVRAGFGRVGDWGTFTFVGA